MGSYLLEWTDAGVVVSVDEEVATTHRIELVGECLAHHLPGIEISINVARRR